MMMKKKIQTKKMISFKNITNMKKVIYFFSVIMAFTACNSYDPYQEADLINQETEQKLDSLYHLDLEEAELYKDLESIQEFQENLVKEKKELFKDEKLETFKSEIIDFKEFKNYGKIKEKIQRNQRLKYDRIMDGYYLKDNLDPYSVFKLEKDYDYIEKTKTGSLDFYSRKGKMNYEIKNDLMYFEGIDSPFFIKESTGKDFILVNEDLETITFKKGDENLVVLGDFEAMDKNEFYKFNLSIVDYNRIMIDNEKYNCDIQRKNVYFDGEFFDEYHIRAYNIPQSKIVDKKEANISNDNNEFEEDNLPATSILFSLLKDRNNNNHFDCLTSLKYYKGTNVQDVWMRKFKDMPKDMNEFMKE